MLMICEYGNMPPGIIFSVLRCLHEVVYSLLFLLLISSAVSLLSYGMGGVVSGFIYLLRLALCSDVW